MHDGYAGGVYCIGVVRGMYYVLLFWSCSILPPYHPLYMACTLHTTLHCTSPRLMQSLSPHAGVYT